MSPNPCQNIHPHYPAILCQRPKGHTRLHRNRSFEQLWTRDRRLVGLKKVRSRLSHGERIATEKMIITRYMSNFTFRVRNADKS